MRKVLLVGTGALAGLVVVTLAVAMVLLSTGPGHRALERAGLRALAQRIDGTVRVGALSGSLWRAADVRDVEITDRLGRPLVKAERVRVAYGLADLLRGRIVMRRLELVRPVVVIEQRRDGTWNYQHVLKLLDTTRTPSPRRANVDLRNVTVEDGTVILIRRPQPDSTDTRRLSALDLALRRLRLSNPDTAGMLAVFTRLAGRLDDPRVVIAGGDGTVAIDSDSLQLSVDHLAIGRGTHATIAGKVRWGRGVPHPVGDLALNAAPLEFADLQAAVTQLPRAGGGRFGARLELLADGTRRIAVRRADVASGRTRARGDVELSIAPDRKVTVAAADVRLAPLDLASLRQYVDTLPASGLVTGHVVAKGPLTGLTVDADLSFADESPGAGGAVSHVGARGVIGFGAPAGVSAHGLVVAGGDIALASLSRITRHAPIAGHLLFSGEFNGPWRGPSVTSLVLALQDGTAPATRLHGQAVFDSARVFGADLRFDTLAFAQLSRLVPGLPKTGFMAGTVQASGPLDSLGFYVALSGTMGGTTARGMAIIRDTLLAVSIDGTLDSLDASRAVRGGPMSRLIGRWSGDYRKAPRDSTGHATASLQLALDSFSVEGVKFTRAGAALQLDERQLLVDSAYVDRPDLRLFVTGALGRPGAAPRQLTIAFHADSLERVAPLVRWARTFTGSDTSAADSTVPAGELQAHGRLVGMVDSFDIDGTIESTGLRYDTMGVKGLRLVIEAAPHRARPTFDVIATADSGWIAGRPLSGIDVRAQGSVDTFALAAAATLEQGSDVRTRLRVARDSVRLVAHVDTLEVGLAGVPWIAPRPFTVAVSPEAIALDSAELIANPGRGRLRASGSLPRRAAGDFSLTADSVPLAGIYALLSRDTTGVGGYVDASARISGSAEAPDINLVLGLVDGRFGDYRAPLFQVVGRYEDRRLTFKGGLWRDTTQVLNVGASLPVDLSLVKVPSRRVQGDYAITARADSVDLALLNQVTTLVRDLRGRLVADVRLTGSWDGARRVDGTVGLVDGAVTIPAIGKRYTGISAQLGLSDSGTITVQRMRLSSGGTLDATGRVLLVRSGPPLLDLTLRASRFNAMDMRRFAGVTASGDLTLRGPALGAMLRGNLTIDAGYLLFTDLVEKRIVNLDDPEFRAIVDSSLAASHELAPGIVTVFTDSLRIGNLSVAMGSNVWLRSTEANIQLTGDFRVSKTVEDGLPRYRLDGVLNANRGTYRLNLQAASKDFRVTRGEVRFFGTPDFNPELDIVAEHQLRTQDGTQMSVRALIQGTLLAPRLTLESDQRPPLTETEIISYLLFGRPSFELASGTGGPSGQQQILADAVTSLAGVSAGLLEQSLVSDLGLPIDYLTIRPGTGTGQQDVLGGARVEAGTQLGSRTFLTLNAGLCEVRQGQASRLLGFSLEYQLSRNWMAQLSYEPIVRQCQATTTQTYAPGNYQLGFDLFWQTGIR